MGNGFRGEEGGEVEVYCPKHAQNYITVIQKYKLII